MVASYLLARPQAWPAGIAIGTLSSLLQGAVSVLIVIVLALVFEVGGLDLMAHATVIELVSYGLIVMIGAWLLFQAVTGRGCHAHGHHHHIRSTRMPATAHGHDHGGRDTTTLGLILAAGITPCASAIIIMLFALAQDAIAVGIGAAFAMSLGMGVTVSAVALLSIFGRRTVTAAVAGNARIGMVVERGLALAGALLVIGLAGLLMLGALGAALAGNASPSPPRDISRRTASRKARSMSRVMSTRRERRSAEGQAGRRAGGWNTCWTPCTATGFSSPTTFRMPFTRSRSSPR